MKLAKLKKRILAELAIYLLIFVTEISAAYFLLTLQDDYIQEGEGLVGQIASLSAQQRALQEQYIKAQKSMPNYYEIIKKRDSAGLSLNRQKAKQTLDALKDKYHMPSIRLSISPVLDAKDPLLKRKTSSIISSDVGIRFEGLSDQHVFGLVAALPSEMAGSLRITRFVIFRVNNLSNDILLAITEKGMFTLVGGELQMEWMGIRKIEEEVEKKAGGKP